MSVEKDRVGQSEKPVFPVTGEPLLKAMNTGIPWDALGLTFREAAAIVCMHAMILAIRQPEDYATAAANCVRAADALALALVSEE